MRETRVADATDRELVTRQGYPGVEGDLRAVFLSAPSDELVNRHVAAMLVLCEATRALSRDARRKRRARVVVGSSLGVGVALVAGASAAAVTGGLPGPIQQIVAEAVAPLGVDLPAAGSDEAPGRGGETPGAADEAPGHQDGPGNSENAPGSGGENPGRSETAPGHSDSENNRPAEAPEQPSANAAPQAQDPAPAVQGPAPPADAGIQRQDKREAGGENRGTSAPQSEGQGNDAPGRNR